MKSILYISAVVSVITYLFWNYLPKDSFYIGNALFISLICMYIFIKEPKSFITFVLFCLSINNLFDELFFDNTKLQLNEIAVGIAIILFGAKKYKNDRKRD